MSDASERTLDLLRTWQEELDRHEIKARPRLLHRKLVQVGMDNIQGAAFLIRSVQAFGRSRNPAVKSIIRYDSVVFVGELDDIGLGHPADPATSGKIVLFFANPEIFDDEPTVMEYYARQEFAVPLADIDLCLYMPLDRTYDQRQHPGMVE